MSIQILIQQHSGIQNMKRQGLSIFKPHCFYLYHFLSYLKNDQHELGEMIHLNGVPNYIVSLLGSKGSLNLLYHWNHFLYFTYHTIMQVQEFYI